VCQVTGLAVDKSGDIFFSNYGAGTVSEVLAGQITPTSVNARVLATALDKPYGLAVDSSGDVFVADLGTIVTGDPEVKEIIAVNGSIPDSPSIVDLATSFGFDRPYSLAVDSSGNVYVADTGNDAVKERTAASNYELLNTLGSGFKAPRGVAVDAYGDIFVADTGNSAVKEMVAVDGDILPSSPINTLGSGFSSPRGVALDGVGNLFVADTGNSAVKEITIGSGYTTVNTMVSGLASPAAVAVSPSGNLYIAGAYKTVLEEDSADAPSLVFGSTDGLSIASADQSITVQNIGNASLTFELPSSGTNPCIPSTASYFTLDTAPATACALAYPTAPATLAAGQSCTLSVSFDPTATGSVSGSLNLLDNTLNAPSPYATQSIALSGTGLESQAINFTAPTSSAGYGASAITLSATATSGLPVTFSIVSGPGELSGTNNSQLTLTGVGTVVVAANQAGNATYAPAAQVTESVSVAGMQDFTVTANPTSLSTNNGASDATLITVTPLNGFASAVTFSCSSGVTCTFAPTSVTPSGSPISTMLTVTNTTAAASLGSKSRPFFPATSLVAALCLLGFKKRRRLQMLLLLAVSVIGLGMFTGCGGGSSTYNTSEVTVTATSGSGANTLQRTVSFLLTVKQ
jgi:hypothetical protein